MTSEIRTNSLKSRAGLSTVTLTDSGPMFSGITTFVDNSTFSVGTGGTIHAPATNTLNIGVNNTESIRIDSNSNLKVAGIVTATHFYGNGSNLSGISAGTSLSGSTNNTVCTVTGANAIQGESSLTYDGTSLKIGGDSGVSGTWNLETYNSGGDGMAVIAGTSGARLLLQDTVSGEKFLLAANGQASLYSQGAGDDMVFYTKPSGGSDTARLRIDSTGRVGINKTPALASSKLEVGGADNYPLINVEASGATAGMGIGGAGLQFFYGTSEKVRITSNAELRIGNLGHATSKVGGQNITGQDYDPYFKLYASTANHWLMQLRSDSTSGNGIFLRSGNSSSNYTLYTTGYDENNAHFLVRGDGVCSIGAKYTQGGANPQLSMYGSSGRQFKIMNSGANTTGMQLQNSTTGYGEDAGVQFACLGGGGTYLVNQYNGANALEWYSRVSGSGKHIMRVYNDGKIGHQTNSDNLMLSNSQDGTGSNYFLRGSKNSTVPGGGNDCVWIYEDGDIRNNNNSYGQQSDIKLKENIVDAGTQWDDIKNLKVRKFNFKASTGFDTHTQIGLIAQEAELVSPGLVKEVKDRVKTEEISEVDGSTSYKESLSETEKTKHVMYSVLYMKAIKALQEAMTRIETLEQDNITLRARVTNLEGE